ncbi:hypothetical protein RBI80_20565 [Klebsiella variicola]|nr:hypothetical protein RBI80_20565 [Klebsiella variicola]
MLLIARRTALAAALLLVMPVTVWLSGWLWQPGLPVAMLKTLWWVTETVTQPVGIITHVALCGWFLWCLRYRLRAALILFLILAAAILVGQGVKSGSKRGFRAETLCHLAGKLKTGAGDAILCVEA